MILRTYIGQWLLICTLCHLIPFDTQCQVDNKAFSTAVESAVSEGFSGVILAAEKGKPFYHESFGFRDFEAKVPMEKNDLFELASVSKQFTAMIILMLQEEKKLSFEDDISNYVSVPYPGITLRHLLNHTSGLPDYQQVMDQYWDKTKVASNKEIIEYLNRYAPKRLFEPGEKYEYSNTGYVLLASIAEKVSGKDFIALCRQWIFEPLKMTSTNIRTLEEKASTPAFALGHVYSAEQQSFIHASRFRSADYTFWLGNRKGPGRISSNAADLLRWDQALYRNRLVSAASLQQAFTPGLLNNGDTISYGFGWMLPETRDKNGIVFHTGDNPGYQTKIVRFLNNKRTLILLCNNDYKYFDKLCEKLESILSTQ